MNKGFDSLAAGFRTSMNHEEFKNKWKNLIFAPLNLPCPPIDVDKLTEWTNNNADHERKFYENIEGKPFTDEYWEERTWGARGALWESYFVHDPWQGDYGDFFDHFPDVKDWFKTLPLVEGKRLTFGFLKQRDTTVLQEKNQYLSSTIHTDEVGSFGLRWFLNNQQNNLFFYPAKVEIDGVITKQLQRFNEAGTVLYTDDNVPLPNEDLLYPNYVKVNTRKDTAFILGQLKAAHWIKHESSLIDKYTFIVNPIGILEHRWDWTKVDAILTESIKTHPDEVIYHNDFYN